MPERPRNSIPDDESIDSDATQSRGERAERRALESLSLRFRAGLNSFFRRRVRDRTEAEDLTQEVFLRMIRRGNVATLEHARAYLFETASSVLLDRARRRAVRPDQFHENFDPLRHGSEGFSSERVLLGQQALERASRALLDLPPRTRSVFVLRQLEGLPYQEIAQQLGISVSAVEKHMMRAVSFLTQRMGED